MASFRSIAISNAATVADLDAFVAAQKGLTLMGVVARESAVTPAAAEFNVKLGADATGTPVLAFIALAASESGGVWYGDRGVSADAGISVEHVSGTYDITIYYVVAD